MRSGTNQLFCTTKCRSKFRYENKKQLILVNKSDYYFRNKKAINEKKKLYKRIRRKDVLVRLVDNIRSRLNKAIKANYKAGSAVSNLGCSIEFLKTYLELKFTPGMTWSNYGKWHIDHIRPLSSFDLTDPKDIKIACHYTNLQPLWAKENIRKSDNLT